MGRYAMWKLDDPQKLRKQLLKLEQKLPGELEKALRKEAETAVLLANSRIPEEKKELRKGWEIGSIQRQGETISVEIRHSSPEAAQLEYGSGTDGSLQQGQFMLALALAELERDWPIRLEQSLSALLLGKEG
ncbi:HK97 gp10 family phage protein [Paenibacillus pasadenensis]|uniref:HK97 gp10 family phage protein n=1 Tax=Paenibacillus pasadenensis TaxID=217090 RepID=UPI00203B08AA|nr:HK97 gp10 family phage protein [Paenibacillus pasadenensis]MCM3748037.1 HK97 gp10 family phage protein [Paenibacillus pasadenensis]